MPATEVSSTSLQRRMDVALLYPICLVMVLAAASAYYLAAHFSRVVHDHWLSDSANSLAQAIASGPDGARLDLDERVRAFFGWDAEDRIWYRLVSPTRGTVGGSTDVPLITAADDADAIGGTRFFESSINGERVRVATLNLPVARYGEPLTLLVAETVRKRTRTAREIATAVLLPQLLLTALAIGLLLRAVRRTVRPLQTVAARLSEQSHSSLDPVPLNGAPLEVHPLIHALNDVLTRLKGIVDTKREMLATAAHNLRTPLAAALLHLQRVRAADESSAQALTTAQTSLRRAAHAAHQVLSLAHAEANAGDPSTFVAVDLCALAHQMGAELAPTAMEKGHSLSLEVPDKVVYAQGHYDLLLSAAMNLLDNAIKYTPRGGDIVVSVCDSDLAGIQVTDNGPGFVPPARGEGGDERFVRGKHSARSGVAGAGLGLSIVREVASRHRGRLELTAGPEGRGTIATLWVPRARAAAQGAPFEPPSRDSAMSCSPRSNREENPVPTPTRRVVTGHDKNGKSIVLSDGPPPQHHPMSGKEVGADFHEMWNVPQAMPTLTSTEPREPNEREFTIMPAAGHLLRIIDIYPPKEGGKRTVMHRTRTIDYVVVIEGEIVLVLDDSEVTLRKSDVVVQRGTDHAWENRSDKIARMAFFHIDAQFSDELLAKLPEPLDLMR